MQNVQVRVRHVRADAPLPEDFELVEAPAAAPGAGQFLCRARWIALDPGFAAGVPGRAGSVLPGRAVAEVIESRNDVFGVGACVELEHGLQRYSVSDGARVHTVRAAQNPPYTALTLLGLPGLTAYFGLLEHGRLQRGELVLVTDAAGPVGSVAGQIAQLHGARAIGLARTREQCDWVTKTARFSACVDIASGQWSERLRALAPAGATLLFASSNDTAALASRHLARDGRTVRAFDARSAIASEYGYRRDEFLKHAMAWYGEGLLVHREEIVDGLQNAAAQLCGVSRGEPFGATLVRV